MKDETVEPADKPFRKIIHAEDMVCLRGEEHDGDRCEVVGFLHVGTEGAHHVPGDFVIRGIGQCNLGFQQGGHEIRFPLAEPVVLVVHDAGDSLTHERHALPYQFQQLSFAFRFRAAGFQFPFQSRTERPSPHPFEEPGDISFPVGCHEPDNPQSVCRGIFVRIVKTAFHVAFRHLVIVRVGQVPHPVMPGKPADELQHDVSDRCAEPSGKLQRKPQQFVVRPFVETVEAEREPALYQFQIDALGKEIIHNLVEADNVLPRMWRPPALWKRQADSQQGGIVSCRTVQVVEGFPCGHIGVRAFFRTFRIIVGSDGKKSSRQKIITLAGGGSSLFSSALRPG